MGGSPEHSRRPRQGPRPGPPSALVCAACPSEERLSMRLSTARVPRSSYGTPARSDRHRVGWVARYGGLCTGEQCCDGLGKIAFVAAQDSTMIQRALEGEAHIARPKRAFTGCKHGKCAVVANLQCLHARKRAPTRAGERLLVPLVPVAWSGPHAKTLGRCLAPARNQGYTADCGSACQLAVGTIIMPCGKDPLTRD